jgi:ribosomal protein S18 acetylase RimI-like enzyme
MGGPAWTLRPGTVKDFPAIQYALACALDWRTPEKSIVAKDSIEQTGHAYLLAGWGRRGDTAVVAESSGQSIGAAWYRYWTDDEHSYGYVHRDIPELGIGIDSKYRRQGLGMLLMTALIDEARKEGVGALSLSVEKDNPALRLYHKLGFEDYDASDSAWTLVKRFDL